MPKSPKPVENMTKHLTQDEREARTAAEEEFIPRRAEVILIMPPGMSLKAKTYWKSILQRLEDSGTMLLDDLDSETFGLYCNLLARRDRLDSVCNQLMSRLSKAKDSADQNLEVIEKLDGVMAKLSKMETLILQYAEKLGMTPSGRIRLAQKKAAKIAADLDTDDLFGD
ncbi:MAG: P27 family phage terminase small subunit [Oscillospiraceae bacterium]|nr:P27 family phage terminase small subunit [Oscillospiraceae bacterium]